MDHNLEDSMTMESIENMDFDHSGVVINQEDISLEDGSQADDISMDLDTSEEQPTMLEAGNEEVVVADFMGDQFGFQEYSMQGENSSGANITIEANQLGELNAQSEQVIDLQYAERVSKATTSQPSLITIKAVQQRGGKKAIVPAVYPRQVAIAPKPIKGASSVQYAIAPKPVSLMMNKNTTNLSKTVPIKNVVQGLKGNTVLAQIGKQLVMVPAGSTGQKIKLGILPTGSSDSNIQYVRCSSDTAQLIANKGSKGMRTKFVVQGQSNPDPSNQPAVITKLMPVSATGQARYVMQQKTVPISIGGNKVVLTSPPKQPVKVAPKKQIISIKAQSPKLVTSQGNVQTKKVVISANPTQSQNVILKAAGGKTVAQVVKEIQAQRTQLHPINVPGKGIQYIKLVTNQQGAQKSAAKPQTLAMSGKNFVLTDSKGNIIQMTSDKVVSGQPPPLIVSSSKVPSKAKKLVRIAPISHTGETPSAKVREATKMAYCIQPKPARASQSLLMPRDNKAVLSGTTVSLEEFNEMVDQNNLNSFRTVSGDDAYEEATEERAVEDDSTETGKLVEPADVKPTLASLLSDAVTSEENVHAMTQMEEIEIEYESTPRKQEQFIEDENTNSMEHEETGERPDENLIIVPSNISHNDTRQVDDDMYAGDTSTSMEDGTRMQTVLNVEADVMPYLSPRTEQNFSDSVFMFDGKSGTPGLCPRKACNCTKSQCLKLYCDCFANGEFCNKCNCNNCHNNLENEELRQKAIRACLERNPNAFRPKIGKSKSGGPEIVRRHNKGCNCKRSGCLKNYCECYEAKIPCTMMCKCVGCRNIEETLERRRDAMRLRDKLADASYRPPLPLGQVKQPCSFMTPEVIEAVAQCMLATATAEDADRGDQPDPVEDILLEFSRCMADIISASHQAL